MEIEVQITLTRGKRDIDIDAWGEVEPLVPGRLSGPPERCFPDEGGFADLTRAECACCGHEIQLTDEERGRVEEALYSEAERLSEIAYEDAMERRYDR